MRKRQFLFILKNRLSGLSEQEVLERVNFYSEIIEDKIEEGMTEQEAVAEIGPIEDIVSQILSDSSVAHEERKTKPKSKSQLSITVILLLVLGSPIWLSLAVSAFAIIISFYAVLWSVTVSLWATFASLAACGVGGVLSGIIFALSGNVTAGLAVIGAGLICAGLSVYTFFACRAVTEGVVKLTKITAVRIINRLVKREVA